MRVVQIAGDLVPARGGEEARGCNRATDCGIVAACGKTAARHHVCGWAHGALNHPQLLIMAHATWDGLQELTRVWMAWLSEDSFTCAGLHERARIHDEHTVAHLVDDAKIVRDQQQGHANLTLQRLHQVQNLSLDSHVERRGRLVGDHQARTTGNRHGNHHPLPHTARELVRIAAHDDIGRRYAHLCKQLSPPACGLCPVKPLVQDQRFTELVRNREHRIEGRQWLLKDHGDAVPPDTLERRFIGLQQIGILKTYTP